MILITCFHRWCLSKIVKSTNTNSSINISHLALNYRFSTKNQNKLNLNLSNKCRLPLNDSNFNF